MLLIASFINGCASQQHKVDLGTTTPEGIKKAIAEHRCTQGAHRGDSVLYVENTLPAIHSARQSPEYKFIEFDVQYSADKQAVVFHDSSLQRLFGQRVKVKKTPYEELCRLSENKIPTYTKLT